MAIAHSSARLGQSLGQSGIGVRSISGNPRFEPCRQVLSAVNNAPSKFAIYRAIPAQAQLRQSALGQAKNARGITRSKNIKNVDHCLRFACNPPECPGTQSKHIPAPSASGGQLRDFRT
jgi:hypothetical protein